MGRGGCRDGGMTRHDAVCWEPQQEWRAMAVAKAIRAAGIPCDYAFQGKADKQFDRAKRDGAENIVTVRADDCRIWRRDGQSVPSCTMEQVIAYYEWLGDGTDTLDDPPDFMLDYSARQASERLDTRLANALNAPKGDTHDPQAQESRSRPNLRPDRCPTCQ